MKKLYLTLFILLLVCVVGTVVFLILLPDQVPVHFRINGEADRIGSKYANLIWPLLSFGLAAAFMGMGRIARKKDGTSNEKILVIVGICVQSFFTLLGFYSMWKSVRYDPASLPQMSYDDLNRFIGIGVGALLVVAGNFLPKARRNTILGVRTKWSMANDGVWRKSQRFGGIVMVIAGFGIMLLSLFLTGIRNTLAMAAVILVSAVLCTVASYRYYLADQEGEDK